MKFGQYLVHPIINNFLVEHFSIKILFQAQISRAT